MERRGHRQQHRAPGALPLRDLDRALDRGLVAGDHDLPAAIVVRRLAHLTLRGLGRDRRRGIEFQSEQRRHRAGADRHRGLHGAAADAQQPRGIGNRSARRRRRAPNIRRANGRRRTRRRARDRRRPRSPSTRIAASETAISAGWAFSVSVSRSAGPSHMTAVSFSPSASSTSANTLARGGKIVRERLAHADGLAALARKNECNRHVLPRKMRALKTTRRHPAVSSRRKSSRLGNLWTTFGCDTALARFHPCCGGRSDGSVSDFRRGYRAGARGPAFQAGPAGAKP